MEDNILIILYDANKKLLGESEGVDWDDNREIDETFAIVDKESYKEENP